MMMRISTRLYEYCDKSRLENLIKSRLEKLCGFPDFYARDVDKSPVSCYARLVHNTQTHSIQIQNRLPNAINYCFIFKKPFFN